MNPNWAYDILRKDPNHKDREVLEQTISESAECSCLYAEHVIKGRFVLGEYVISKDAEYSCEYAEHEIKGRFVLGEEAISKDARSSYEYARYVIGGRLPDTMHRKMLAFGIIDSSDRYVKRYLDYIGSKKYCTLKRKDTKNESRTSV